MFLHVREYKAFHFHRKESKLNMTALRFSFESGRKVLYNFAWAQENDFHKTTTTFSYVFPSIFAVFVIIIQGVM